MLTVLNRLVRSEEAREQLAVFASHLTVNLAFFVVMLAASVMLEPSEFAKLSLANSAIVLIATVFGLGMDESALKLSIERGRSGFVAVNLLAKAGLFAMTVVPLLAGMALFGPSRELVVAAAAAGVAFWASTRVVEQYQRRFARLAGLNLTLAATRIGFGGFSLLSRDWVLIALAVHVLAQLPIHLATLTGTLRELRPALDWRDLRGLVAVSPLVFASATLFSALPLLTQSALYARGDVLATSAFGVTLIFMAPLGMLIGTIRIYVLPQVLQRGLREVDLFGLGRGSIHVVAAAFAAALLAGTLPAALAIEWVYGDRLPPAGSIFLIYFGAQVATAALGLYNIRAARQALIAIEAAVNLGRAAATAVIGFLVPLDPLGVVAASAAVLVIGEAVLWAALRRADRSRAR